MLVPVKVTFRYCRSFRSYLQIFGLDCLETAKLEPCFLMSFSFFALLALFQLFFGAWMRHIGAGLAIPDFPTSFGHWIPPTFTYWIKIHFIHRLGALFITAYLIFFLAYGYSVHRESRIVRFFLPLLLVLIVTQVSLGASVIWTGRNVVVTSLHVLVGATILSSLVMMSVVSFKHFSPKTSYHVLMDYVSLGKPRITIMVCMTALVGFYLGSGSDFDLAKLLWTLWSIFLVSFGACSLNQVMEVEADQAMDRTRDRPIPSGRLTKSQGILVSFATVLVGVVVMYFKVGTLPLVFLLLSLVGYVFFYTPLKRVSHYNTLIGAIPGALPPVIGWVAATNQFSFAAFLLFLIMFLWQLPHFLAIAWMYSDDYKKAKMRMLPLMEGTGTQATQRQALLYAFALFPVSLVPSFVGIVGKVYFFGALFISLWFIRLVYLFFKNPDKASARQVLLGSFVYLLVVFSLMVANRL